MANPSKDKTIPQTNSDELGTFTKLVYSSKIGEATPVRRSKRIDSILKQQLKEEQDENESPNTKSKDLDDLCSSLFSMSIAVNDSTLQVNVHDNGRTQRQSKMPESGRFTSLTGFSPTPKDPMFSPSARIRGSSEFTPVRIQKSGNVGGATTQAVFVSPVKRSARVFEKSQK